MARNKYSALAAYADELHKNTSLADKRRVAHKRKLAEEVIGAEIVKGNVTRAVELAQKHGISAKEFGKLTAKYAAVL